MEAATENQSKRGRPKTITRQTADATAGLTHHESIRAIVNDVYMSTIVIHLKEPEKSFFVTPKGNIRRKGILEQLGRMYDADQIAEDEITECVQSCIGLYHKGYTVKEIEQHLRNIRTGK